MLLIWSLQLEKPQRTPEWETFIKESTAELCVSESQIMKLVAANIDNWTVFHIDITQ